MDKETTDAITRIAAHYAPREAKANAYRGRQPADVMRELDSDPTAVKSVDESLGMTTYTLDDDSLVEVTRSTVRSHSSYTAFCLGMT